MRFYFSATLCIVFADFVLSFVVRVSEYNGHISTESRKTALNGIFGRFRKRKVMEQPDPIQVGDVLPEFDVERCDALDLGASASALSIQEALGPSKSLLVGMPGAFTPVCSQEHLPGYVKNAPKFKDLGISRICILTTNDKFVNSEWAKTQGIAPSSDSSSADNKVAIPIDILCDGDGDFVRAIGLGEDMGFGVGMRSKRFVMVVDNNRIEELAVEDESVGLEQCSATSAESVLEMLNVDTATSTDSGNSGALIVVGAALVVAFFASDVLLSPASPPSSSPSRPAAVQRTVTPPSQKSLDTKFDLLDQFLKK